MNSFILTEQQVEALLRHARSEVVKFLLTERRDDLELLTPAQVCGILNVNQKTLDTLKDGPKRVTLVPGKVVRYRASKVAAYISSREDA